MHRTNKPSQVQKAKAPGAARQPAKTRQPLRAPPCRDGAPKAASGRNVSQKNVYGSTKMLTVTKVNPPLPTGRLELPKGEA